MIYQTTHRQVYCLPTNVLYKNKIWCYDNMLHVYPSFTTKRGYAAQLTKNQNPFDTIHLH